MKYILYLIIAAITFYIGRHSIGWFYPNAAIKAHRYMDNQRYAPKVAYYGTCAGQYNIVMLGDSHIERMNWNELLNRCDIANRGINMDMSEGVLNRLISVFSCKPKTVFLMVGANDINFDVPYKSYISNVGKIIDTITKGGTRVVINSIFHCNENHHNSKQWNTTADLFNKGLDSMAKSLNLPIIKLSLSKDDMYPDSHLTAKGYLLWRNEIVKYIKL